MLYSCARIRDGKTRDSMNQTVTRKLGMRFEQNDFVVLLLLAVGALATTFETHWLNAENGKTIPSIDIYAYSYPIFAYARTALEQGHGPPACWIERAHRPHLD